jgi:Predicted RNA methylase
MKLKQLEIQLEKIEGFSRPSPRWEQYQTPATLAARLLFHAYSRGDISGKRVCDLGCGTGILAIGASVLGAAQVTGYDIDDDALNTARKNAEHMHADPVFISGDISDPGFASAIPVF